MVPIVQHPGHPAAASLSTQVTGQQHQTVRQARLSTSDVCLRMSNKPANPTGAAAWQPMKLTMLADQAAALR